MYVSALKNSARDPILTIDQDQHFDSVKYRDRIARTSRSIDIQLRLLVGFL